MVRILITGSRDWDDEVAIRSELNKYIPSEDLVVTGYCPRGADLIAEMVWQEYGGKTEVHPAMWGQFGNSAGFRRNAKMVALGADICLAFILNDSKGATMCANLAEKAGIPVRRIIAFDESIQ